MKHEEYQYLDLLKNIKENGIRKKNRTGIDTLGIVGSQMRFSLRDGKFPLLTTKKTYFKAICHELLWFISGSTRVDYLRENGIKIWEGNTKEYFERITKNRGELSERARVLETKIKDLQLVYMKDMYSGDQDKLDAAGRMEQECWAAEDEYYSICSKLDWMDGVQEGDIGPVYGYQWRNFNGQKCDQLKNAIKTIRTDPDSRRIIVSAWNPLQIEQMALPPCHVMFQFVVENDDLSCLMYQRSVDTMLGLPFNIASYALLTHLVASVTGKKAKEFIWMGGDCHIYENHLDGVAEQMKREPFEFPKISINKDIKEIEDFKFEDINLVDYVCHNTIKMEMAV